jgi:hypothetical protein
MFDDLGHDVQPHAQARNRFPRGISDPIEPLKNVVAQFSRDAQAMIADTDRRRRRVLSELRLYLGRAILFLVCSSEKQPDHTRN